MKIKILIFVFPVILISCSGNNNDADAYGNFEAKEVIVSAQSQGSLIKLDIEEGQSLKKEKLVGVIDTVPFRIQKEQLWAQKQVISAKLANIKAQINVQEEQKIVLGKEKSRIETLFNDNAATEQQYDDINGRYNILEKQIEATKTQISSILREMEVIDMQVKLVDEQIKKAKIVNPIDGTVLEKYLEEDEIVVTGKALYKIARLDEIDLRVYISGDQVHGIKLGQKVKVYIDKDKETNQEMDGEVFWISDQAEFTPKIIQTKEERVNMVYAVKIRVKNDGTLKIGMPGEVRF